MKKFTFLLAVCCVLISGQLQAQKNSAKAEPESFKPVFLRSAGVHISTQGLGFEVQHPMPYHMNIRIGASFLPDFNTSGNYKLNGYSSEVTAGTSDVWNTHLLIDVQPFYKAQSFARKFILTLGAGYFANARASAHVKFGQNYKYGDLEFSGDEIGELTAVSSWAGFAPYGGIGVNNVLGGKRFGLNLGLGTYYMAEPSVVITGTNMLSENASNARKLAQNLSDYKWLPVLQLNFNYKF